MNPAHKDSLYFLRELRDLIARPHSGKTTTDAWAALEMLELRIAAESGHDPKEKKLLASIRSSLSDYTLAQRKGLNPHFGSGSASLSALESSIMKRSFGEDGWPNA